MADNTTLNTGSGGDTIATDDIAGIKHQRVKVQYGVDGSATDVSDTNPLPVDDAGGSLTVDNAALSVTGGGVEASALRVTLATDSTGVVSVDDNGGSLTVDGTVAISGTVAVTDNAGSLTVDNAGTFAVQADTELTTADLDTGAGTDTRAVVGLAGTASGGAQLIPGSSTDGLLVNLGANNDVTVTGTVTANAGTGPFPVSDNGGSLTVDGTVAATQSGTWTLGANSGVDVGDVTINNASGASAVNIQDGGNSITVDGTVTANLAAGTNNIGDVDVLTLPSLPAGTNNIGDVDVLSIAAGTNTIGAVNVKPTTSGGLTIFRSIDLDETEEEIKATAGQLYGWFIFNAAASTHYVKFYNATAATVVVGTTTPVLTIPVPAGSAANVEFANGIAFGTAITAAATTGIADADTGAPAANAVTLNAFYA
jgi:hypothetical protein